MDMLTATTTTTTTIIITDIRTMRLLRLNTRDMPIRTCIKDATTTTDTTTIMITITTKVQQRRLKMVRFEIT